MFTQRKLLTVVCEGALESRLIKDLLALGAKGYTVTDSHGTGPKNQRNADLEGGNIRLEVVTDEATLSKIIERLQANYFPNYAVSAWVAEVEVLRQDRY
jgi:nitrogen regulatory protein P-II 2